MKGKCNRKCLQCEFKDCILSDEDLDERDYALSENAERIIAKADKPKRVENRSRKKSYYQEHKGEILAKAKAKRDADPELAKQQRHERYLRERDRALNYQKKYNDAHKEYKKAKAKEYYRADPEKHKAYQKKYWLEHQEQKKAYNKAYYAKKKAEKENEKVRQSVRT